MSGVTKRDRDGPQKEDGGSSCFSREAGLPLSGAFLQSNRGSSSDVKRPREAKGADVDMTAAGIMGYFRGLQTVSQLSLRGFVHTAEDRGYALSGREPAVSAIVRAFRGIEEACGQSSDDRKRFPVLVCCGLSGLGKTRMLEEWPQYFELAGASGRTAGVIVQFFNGYSVRALDRDIGWEASVAWRSCTRFFCA
jgi:hypothetical protein